MLARSTNLLISLFIISTYSEFCVTRNELDYIPSAEKMVYFQKLYDRNCTHLIGNLILQDLTGQDENKLTFLDNIREIYGFLYLKNLSDITVNLKKLRSIRGENYGIKTNSSQSTSLYIHDNSNLKLFMPSLSVIHRGDVVLYHNTDCCFINSFDWNIVLYNEYKQTLFKDGNDFNNCNWTCDNICKNACWNEGFSGCHLISNNFCPETSNMDSKYCFRENELLNFNICHSECIGGCYGKTSHDCLSCKRYSSNGNCIKECSDGAGTAKLKLANFCVDKCPTGMLIQDDVCVIECDLSRYYLENGVCKLCDKEGCPLVCTLDKLDYDFLDATDLKSLQNCTILDGNLVFESASFDKEFLYGNRQPIRNTAEFFALSNLRVVTGYVIFNFRDFHPQDYPMKNMSFLWKLSEVRGFNPFGYSFEIDNSNLSYLGTSSLRYAPYAFGLYNNTFLCYVQTLPWFRKMPDDVKSPMLKKHRIKGNLAIYQQKGISLEECEQIGNTCHSSCNQEAGCWGPDSFDCVLCENDFVNSEIGCVNSCSDVAGYRSVPRNTKLNAQLQSKTLQTIPQSNDICEACHPECMSKCSGPSAYDCLGGCKNAKEDGKCIPKCSRLNYLERNLRECLPCHKHCNEPLSNQEEMCSGPQPTLGLDGCSSCNLYYLLEYGGYECVKTCPEKMFKATITNEPKNKMYWDNLTGTKVLNASFIVVCSQCEYPCIKCNAPGISLINGEGCLVCSGFWHRNKCVSECPIDETYTMLQTNPSDLNPEKIETFQSSQVKVRSLLDKCLSCHEECLDQCWGHRSKQCFRCKHFTIATRNTETNLFEIDCVKKCPSEKPFVFSGKDGLFYCYHYDKFLNGFINETTAGESPELLSYLKTMVPMTAFQEAGDEPRLSKASSIGLIAIATIATTVLLLSLCICFCLKMRLKKVRKVGKVPYTLVDLMRALCCGKTLYHSNNDVYNL